VKSGFEIPACGRQVCNLRAKISFSELSEEREEKGGGARLVRLDSGIEPDQWSWLRDLLRVGPGKSLGAYPTRVG